MLFCRRRLCLTSSIALRSSTRTAVTDAVSAADPSTGAFDCPTVLHAIPVLMAVSLPYHSTWGRKLDFPIDLSHFFLIMEVECFIDIIIIISPHSPDVGHIHWREIVTMLYSRPSSSIENHYNLGLLKIVRIHNKSFTYLLIL